MSKYSKFRNEIKVDNEKDKNQRKYTCGDINIREDKETGKLGLYISETLSTIKDRGKGLPTIQYRKKDTNIKNIKEKIYYSFISSISGHSCKIEYDNYNQKRRYGLLYSVPSVLQQVLGISREEAYNMSFTQEELIDLIEKINLEKENAIFQGIDTIQYSENYKGDRTLEGVHIAIGYRSYENNERRFFKCVEDENIKISVSKNGVLEVVKDGKKETIASSNYSFISTDILEDVSTGVYTSLGGYTLDAVRKIVEKYKKEKNKEREEK